MNVTILKIDKTIHVIKGTTRLLLELIVCRYFYHHLCTFTASPQVSNFQVSKIISEKRILTCTLSMLSRFQRGIKKRFAKRRTNCVCNIRIELSRVCETIWIITKIQLYRYLAKTSIYFIHILPDSAPIPFPDSDQYGKFVVLQTTLQSGCWVALQIPNLCQKVSQQQSVSIHQDQLEIIRWNHSKISVSDILRMNLIQEPAMPSCQIQLSKIAKLSIYLFMQTQNADNRQNNNIDGIMTLNGKSKDLQLCKQIYIYIYRSECPLTIRAMRERTQCY